MEFIIALIILIFLFKHLVLNYKINAVVFIIAMIALYYFKPEWLHHTKGVIVLLALNAIDCIRDIVVSEKYYKPISDKIDGLYAIKSISSLCCIALGWFYYDRNLVLVLIPRVLFLILVYPIQYLIVLNDVTTRLDSGMPVPYSSYYYAISKKKCYWYKKALESLNKKGRIISNAETVKEEFKESREKVEENYPQKVIEKLTYYIKKRDKLEELKNAKNRLTDQNLYRHMAYISKDFYLTFKQRLYQVLISKNAVYSPYVIRNFQELKNLHLDSSNGIYNDTEWSDYFIIKILSEYVKSGEINDFCCNDNDPLDNHSYGIKIKSQIASDNPLLSLDD